MTLPLLLCALGAFSPQSSGASAIALPILAARGAEMQRAGPGLLLGATDALAAAALQGRSAFVLELPANGEFPALALELTRVPVQTRDAQLFVDGQARAAGPQALDHDLTIWKGRALGQPDSDALLSFSQHGSRGWVRVEGALQHLVAEADPALGWQRPLHRWISEAQLLASGARPDWHCASDEIPQPLASGTAGLGRPAPAPKSADASSVQLELRLALETDWQLYQLFNDLDAARTYVLQVFGAVSARYDEQIHTVIALPYLGLYTSNNDPWVLQDQGFGSIDVLFDFQAHWSQGMPVAADLGHLMSGAGLGGGVAWLDTLCAGDYCYGVSGNIDAQVPFPIAVGPLNWDFMVTAHEIGHNFNAIHTHDYCPPVDQCAPSGYFGACQSAQVCTNQGSLMSYCHLCSGGLANITTYFHANSVADMRARAENSCLLPYEQVSSTDLGLGKSGSAGTPLLNASYDEFSNKLTASFSGVAAPTTGFLVFGGSALYLPLLGGTLVPLNQVVSVFGVPSGSTSLVAKLSGAAPAGSSIWAQGWFLDLAASNQVSASNGIRLDLVLPAPPPALTWFQHPSNGKEYALTSASGTWYWAEGQANQYGGHLAAPSDAALESWLAATFYASGLASGNLWLGFQDQFHEGQFTWLDGAPTVYTHWAGGQPDNYTGTYLGAEDVTEWWSGVDWNDADGYALQRGLIERPIAP